MGKTFEKINKALLFIALLTLPFRVGSFSTYHIPQLFEIIFSIVFISTTIYLLFYCKGKDFFTSIPKNILQALGILIVAILVGWIAAIFLYKIPSSFNMVLEFGAFIIALALFLLIQFYSEHDQWFAKNFFYALLFPTFYIVFLFVPKIATYLHLVTGGTFNGFTSNVNIVSKMFLIPIVFFTTQVLVENKNIYYKIMHGVISAALFALLLWSAERGAILSAICGMIIVAAIISTQQFSWKKILTNGCILILIYGLGFIMVPHEGKLVFLDRALNIESHQSTYQNIENDSISTVIQTSIHQTTALSLPMNNHTPTRRPPSESRTKIWGYYINRVIDYPIGIGPDTHVESYIPYYRGVFFNPGPHNSYIELFLWGGVIAFGAFIYIAVVSFSRIKKIVMAQQNIIAITILGSLVALLISIFFNDSIALYDLWALFGLSFVYWM